jgi:hypothetical protein
VSAFSERASPEATGLAFKQSTALKKKLREVTALNLYEQLQTIVAPQAASVGQNLDAMLRAHMLGLCRGFQADLDCKGRLCV